MVGIIDAADKTILLTYAGRLGGAGVLSIDEVANDIGYAAYLFNDETGNAPVRNREYSYELGRFLQRGGRKGVRNLFCTPGPNSLLILQFFQRRAQRRHQRTSSTLTPQASATGNVHSQNTACTLYRPSIPR